MKVLFVGPSLAGVQWDGTGIDVRPPARQGDLHLAVRRGATAIGLVDGVFGFVPSVWHKEILFALSQGVRVLGGASIGALRAAECAAYGVQPVGEIAADYIAGRRSDDADVCLAHCPGELGYAPLSEPLVDAEATIAALPVEDGVRQRLHAAARALHFEDRTIEAMVALAGAPDTVGKLYRRFRISAKSRDALVLLDRLRALPEGRAAPPSGWQFRSSQPWQRYLSLCAPSAAGPVPPSSSADVPPAR